MNLDVLNSLAGIALLAILAQLLAWRVRLPAILFLLIGGICAGPLFGLLDPDALFGELLFPVVSLSVAVILFEGALTLRFSEIQGTGATVRNLVTIGALVTLLITAIAANFFVGFDVKLALLFGAVVVVTGPTVIVPMLRTVRPNARIANILRWEGIVIDPLGALLAVLAFDFYLSTESETAIEHIALLFGKIVAIGVALGLASGFGLGELLRRYLIPEYLRSVVTLLLVFVVFAVAEGLHHESGLLAVTIFGMTLANMKDVEIEDILDFKESLSVLLISGLFVILAARVNLDAIFVAGMGSVALLFTIMFVARPFAVFVSTLGSSLNWRERVLIAWIGPRGIVCAAVAALFALRLEAMQVPEAALFVPLAFLVIVGTVVIQSLSAKYLAHVLGVRDPAPSGALIVGAGVVARAIGQALKECDLRVVLSDTSYENIRAARMDGLEVYYGSPVSEHADRQLDLSGIGKLLAMSGRANFDVLAAMNFKPVFGAQNLYELPTSADGDGMKKNRITNKFRGQRLFGEDINFNKMAGYLRSGGDIRSTQLTEEYDYEAYHKANEGRLIPLFMLDASKRLRIVTENSKLEPGTGWRIISLFLPEGNER